MPVDVIRKETKKKKIWQAYLIRPLSISTLPDVSESRRLLPTVVDKGDASTCHRPVTHPNGCGNVTGDNFVTRPRPVTPRTRDPARVSKPVCITTSRNLKLWRIDFVGAYLNSLTKEDIYMRQPEGFIEPGFEDHVCKLVHTIYGTMQGAHDWYETLTNTYDKLGYVTSRADPCVRYKRDGDEYTITDTYTDDVFGALTSDTETR